ncbi:hypothetical protein FRC08_018077 [Ceratobasidium sp. 394]|nr:hypothetical protein FRC08_018077 [Ceratobasidium sp. 394]
MLSRYPLSSTTTMSSLPAPALPSPGSESGSLVFEDGISSDGVSSPNDNVSTHLRSTPDQPSG